LVITGDALYGGGKRQPVVLTHAALSLPLPPNGEFSHAVVRTCLVDPALGVAPASEDIESKVNHYCQVDFQPTGRRQTVMEGGSFIYK